MFSEDCNGIQCKYGSKCVQGTCVCPQTCPIEYESVCANDGRTYRNLCEMNKEACRSNRDLEMIHQGDCAYEGSGSGSGTGEGKVLHEGLRKQCYRCA